MKPTPTAKVIALIAVILLVIYIYHDFTKVIPADPAPPEQTPTSVVSAPVAPDFGKEQALTATYDTISKKVYSTKPISFGQDYDVRVTQVDDSTYYVDNYFDFTNEFNVALHEYYSCYVKYHKTTNSATIDSVTIKE